MHHFQCVIIVLIRESKYEQEFYCQAPQSDMMHKLPNSDSDGVAATFNCFKWWEQLVHVCNSCSWGTDHNPNRSFRALRSLIIRASNHNQIAFFKGECSTYGIQLGAGIPLCLGSNRSSLNILMYTLEQDSQSRVTHFFFLCFIFMFQSQSMHCSCVPSTPC